MSLTTFLIIGGVLIVVLLIIGVIFSVRSEKSFIEERLGKYIEEEEATSEEEKKASKSLISDWVNRRVERSSFGERISRELARADLKFKPGEYIALFVISIIVVGTFCWILGGRNLLSALIGMILGFLLPRMYVKRQQNKRLQRLNDQLPDMINLMVNGLRAGYSTMQAMEAVSKELAAPVCDEFRRVIQEMQLGIPMERALANLLRRIPSDDLDFVITAINVQREVGGNLAEILDVIAFTIRERVRIKGEIRVLTAQVMTSGRVLALLPIILMLILWFINQEYMREFFQQGACGYMALVVSAVMISTGYFIMTRIAKIEV